MLNKICFTLIFMLTTFKFCKCDLTVAQKNAIESLINKLNVKHLDIISEPVPPTNFKIWNFVKHLSTKKISTNFLSPPQMENSMHLYYRSPYEHYQWKNKSEMDKKRKNLVYPPKTIVIILGENFSNIFATLFKQKNFFAVSKYIWAILDELPKSLLSDINIHIPYDSQFLIIKEFVNGTSKYLIEEVYHPVYGNIKYLRQNLGTWESSTGLKIFEQDFYKRRLDLNNSYLYAYHNPQAHELVSYKIMLEISRLMNFKLIIPTPEQYTKTRPTQQIEILLNFAGITHFNFYPYTLGPIQKISSYIYIRKSDIFEKHGVFSILRPFSKNFWLAILACITVSEITLLIIYCVGERKFSSKILTDSLFEPVESFLNQCGGDEATKSSVRMASTAVRIAALFIVPAYTGQILSLILDPDIKLPFRNAEEFVQDGSYKLGFLKYTQTDRFFRNSGNPTLKKISEDYFVALEGQNMEALFDGAHKVCCSSKFALYFVEHKFEEAKCEIIKIPNPVTSASTMIPLRYGSPYTKIFNRLFLSLKSQNIIKKMLRDVNDENNVVISKLRISFQEEEFSISEQSLQHIFILLGVFYMISIAVLTVEIIHVKVNKNFFGALFGTERKKSLVNASNVER